MKTPPNPIQGKLREKIVDIVSTLATKAADAAFTHALADTQACDEALDEILALFSNLLDQVEKELPKDYEAPGDPDTRRRLGENEYYRQIGYNQGKNDCRIILQTIREREIGNG